MKHFYIARGLDMQGRHPEAAEACTELGADDDLACAEGIVRCAIVMLALWLALAIGWMAI